jgi:hypothetical protein
MQRPDRLLLRTHYNFRLISPSGNDAASYTNGCFGSVTLSQLAVNLKYLYPMLHPCKESVIRTAILTQTRLNPCDLLTTPCSRVLLEKLTGLQLFNKFLAFYGTRRFITAFTSAHYLSLYSASWIQSIPPHPTS